MYSHYLGGSRFVGLAFLKNYVMYDLGPYPYITPGEGRVFGEVYEINEALIPILDAAETGYDRISEDTYFIGDVDVINYLGPVQTEVYVYNKEAGGSIIFNGDYTRHRGKDYILNLYLPASIEPLELFSNLNVEPLQFLRVNICELDERIPNELKENKEFEGVLITVSKSQAIKLEYELIEMGRRVKYTVPVCDMDGNLYYALEYR